MGFLTLILAGRSDTIALTLTLLPADMHSESSGLEIQGLDKVVARGSDLVSEAWKPARYALQKAQGF